MFWAIGHASMRKYSNITTPQTEKSAEQSSIEDKTDTEMQTKNVERKVTCEHQYVVDNEDLLDKKIRLKIRRLLWYMVLIPFVFSMSLWLLGTYATKDYLPSSLDVHLWRNFSAHVKESVQAMDSKYPHNILLILLGIHAVQVLFCFPLLHVTKLMYGYFFNVLAGGLIACIWELFLVCLFMIVATQNVPVQPPAVDLAGFLHYVESMRQRKMLLFFLVCMHISSVPLITSTCLVLFQVVKRWEFLVSHIIATVLMTFKDTWLGDFLAFSDGNASNIAIAATLLSLSALLPTCITVILMGFISAASVAKPTGYKAFSRI